MPPADKSAPKHRLTPWLTTAGLLILAIAWLTLGRQQTASTPAPAATVTEAPAQPSPELKPAPVKTSPHAAANPSKTTKAAKAVTGAKTTTDLKPGGIKNLAGKILPGTTVITSTKAGGGGSGASPAAKPAVDPFAALDRALATLPLGKVVFNTPERLQRGETATIQLLLGIEQELDELKELITRAGRVSSGESRVAARMQARLTGTKFSITAVTPEEQGVSGKEPTEWRWEIASTETGQHSLHLTLSAKLPGPDGGSIDRVLRTFDRTIEIEVTGQQLLMDFLAEYWMVWLAAIIAAVATAAWRRLVPAKGD